MRARHLGLTALFLLSSSAYAQSPPAPPTAGPAPRAENLLREISAVSPGFGGYYIDNESNNLVVITTSQGEAETLIESVTSRLAVTRILRFYDRENGLSSERSIVDPYIARHSA